MLKIASETGIFCERYTHTGASISREVDPSIPLVTSHPNAYHPMSHNVRSRTTSVRKVDIISLSHTTTKHGPFHVSEGMTNLTITRPGRAER